MRLLRNPLLIATFLAVAISVPASAQEPTAEYGPACDSAKVSKTDVERAHTVFLSGKQYLEESNYDKAIGYFKDAYSIDCSVHAILPIIATAFERKGDKAAAIRTLTEYQKRAPAASDHEVIERRIKNLSDQLAREQPPATVASSQAGAPVSAAGPPLASGTAGTSLPIAPATSAASLAPDATAPGSKPQGTAGPAPWIVTGIGGAAVVVGLVVFASGASDVSKASDACKTRTNCSVDVATRGNNGRTLETVGGTVAGVGIAAVGAGLLWSFLGAKGTTGASAAVPVVTVSPRYTGVGLAGTF